LAFRRLDRVSIAKRHCAERGHQDICQLNESAA
jgi:hypothetical protein